MTQPIPVTRLTKDQLIEEYFANSGMIPAERQRRDELRNEIDRRIRAKNNAPHLDDCLCSDCIQGDTND